MQRWQWRAEGLHACCMLSISSVLSVSHIVLLLDIGEEHLVIKNVKEKCHGAVQIGRILEC